MPNDVLEISYSAKGLPYTLVIDATRPDFDSFLQKVENYLATHKAQEIVYTRRHKEDSDEFVEDSFFQ